MTREQIKAEVDKVEEEYLGVLYRMIKALETPSAARGDATDWSAFIAATYGCLAEAPIERGEQGEFEAREPLR